MHKALYRIWRPAKFSEVVGQDPVVAALKNQILAGRVSHAYIFTGIRGTGKTSLAKILAKAVNCEHPENGEPCGKCSICRGIDSGAITDVSEIDAASNTGVDDIRALRDETAYAPAVAKMRVFIIDEVHMLSSSAWAALLKIMEEPPEHVMFILATTDIQKVPATILSRCIRFDLARFPAQLIEKQLEKVAAGEGFTVEPAAARLIARLADGAMRDALSITEACLGSGNAITLADVERHTAVTDSENIFDTAGAVAANDAAAAVSLLYKMYNLGADAARLCSLLVYHFRSLLLVKLGAESLNEEFTEDELARLRDQADLFPEQQLLFSLETLNAALDSIAKSIDKRLALEVAVIRLCDYASRPPFEAAAPAKKQAASPKTEKNLPETHPVRVPEKDFSPSPAPEAAKPLPMQEVAPGETAEFDAWSGFIAKLPQYDGMLYGLLADSKAYLDGRHLLIDAGEQFTSYMRSIPNLKDHLKQLLAELAGCSLPIGPYKKPEVPAPAADIDDILEKAKSLNIETHIVEDTDQ